MDSMTKNAFLVMGKISNIGNQISNFQVVSPDQLHDECLEFGEDLGTFLRVAIAFETE